MTAIFWVTVASLCVWALAIRGAGNLLGYW